MLSVEKGLVIPAFFNRACHHCENASVTDFAEQLISESGGLPVIINSFSMGSLGCNYQGNPDISIANQYSDPRGIFNGFFNPEFYALTEDRCAFDDSLVEYVAGEGLIDDFKVEIDFPFVPISQISPDNEIPLEFLSKSVRKAVRESKR